MPLQTVKKCWLALSNIPRSHAAVQHPIQKCLPWLSKNEQKATEYCKQLTINKQQQNKQNSKISEKYLTSVKKNW
jgi:hypothetical protein